MMCLFLGTYLAFASQLVHPLCYCALCSVLDGFVGKKRSIFTEGRYIYVRHDGSKRRLGKTKCCSTVCTITRC